MRTLTGDIGTNQASNNRKPCTQITFRDMKLRWIDHSSSGDTGGGYPADSSSGIPWCPIDMDIASDDNVFRVWCDEDGWSWQDDVSPDTDWSSGRKNNYAYAGSGPSYCLFPHRMAVHDIYAWKAYSQDLVKFFSSGSTTLTQAVWRSDSHTVRDDYIALAAVSDYVVYSLALHIVSTISTEDLRYLELTRFEDHNTDGDCEDIGDTEETCIHTIPVDSLYDVRSLTFFDAETFGGRDVLIINDRSYGRPVLMFYDDGVFSGPFPLVPMDIVDSTSYLRISHLTTATDFLGESVLYATGQISYGGSTGQNPQSYNILLRSKDGWHWSVGERFAYLMQGNMRSKLIQYNPYVYYPNGATVKKAQAPYQVAYDNSNLKLSVTSDVLNWSLGSPGQGQPMVGQTSIADANGTYSINEFDTTTARWETVNDDLAIHPGMWLWRYAGYSDEYVVMSIEAVDKAPQSYEEGNRSLSITSRDVVMRSLADWTSVQDWQWLSERKHNDLATDLSYLYAVSATQFTANEEDDRELISYLDQDMLTADDDLAGLKFDTYNQHGIFFSTQPFEAENFQVSIRFKYDHNYSGTDETPGGLQARDTSDNEPPTAGNDLDRLGNGAGVVGCATDGYNAIAAFLDIKGKYLYILKVRGDSDSYTWTCLARTSQISHTFDTDNIYEVSLERRGTHLMAKAQVWSNIAQPTRAELATLSYDWAESQPMVMGSATDDDYANAGNVGILLNINVPETRVGPCPADAAFFPRDYTLWDPTDTENEDCEDDYADWTEGNGASVPPLHIGDELLKPNKVLQSNWKSAQDTVYDKWKVYWKPGSGELVDCWVEGEADEGRGDWDADSADPDMTFCFVTVNGPGAGQSVPIADETEVSGSIRMNFKPTSKSHAMSDFVYDSLRTSIDPSGITADTEYMICPGFWVVQEDGSTVRGATDVAASYPQGTVMRQHFDDYILVLNLSAYDCIYDKTREFILQDIAAKAGVMSFVDYDSIDQTFNLPDFDTEAGPTYLERALLLPDGTSNVEQKDYDLTIELTTALSANDEVGVLSVHAAPGSQPELFDSGSWSISLASVIGVRYGKDGSGVPFVALQQTSAIGDNSDNWVIVDKHTLDSTLDGTRIRFVRYGDFFTVYVNDARARTMHCGDIFGVSEDGYDESRTYPAEIGVYGWSTAQEVTVTQPELYTWTDAVEVGQRQNALAGMQSVFRDQRIKLISRYTGELEMTLDKTPSNLATITDLIYTESVNRTDRIPTHIRTSGEEEVDYIDHPNAGIYGLTFAIVQVPYLDESMALNEAERITNDAVSFSEARQFVGVAQLDWEVEDRVTVTYTPHDGGPGVDDEFIVNSLNYIYAGPGRMRMDGLLRLRL